MGAHPLDGLVSDAFELALFRALVSAESGYVSCVDRQRRVLYLNRTLSRDISEVLGRPMESFLTPPYREAAIACLDRAFETGCPEQLDSSVQLLDGTQRQITTRVVPFRGPDGEEVALLLTSDVSERNALMAQLERSVEFRRRVVENLPDYVVIIDRNRRHLWVNRVAPGLTHEEVLAKRIDDYITEAAMPLAIPAIDAAFASGTSGQYEVEGYGDGKESAWYLVRVAPIVVDGTVENVLLITSDITERRRAERALREAEDQLRRAQHLESLGQLAGGIAHDFNNLLQVICGNLAFVRQNLANGEAAREELEQAMRATERAAELTSHLLTIGRKKRVLSKRVELVGLVTQSVRMLRRTIPENIALKYDAPAEPYYVELDTPQFDQVLINLVVNARDAMPQGGTLSVRIGPDGASHVVVSVSDTGSGIAPKDLNRVFEPFFTTKHSGSGLGLAVAAGIISAHGGTIAAKSDGRSGTTMELRLPRVAAGPNTPVPPRAPARGGTGVILVAEDEELVRHQVVRVLERSGYTALQATNGARAVELFREHDGKVDLVMLDVIMPELDGWQAYLEIETLKPGVKVLFTTGYTANVLPDDFGARGARLLSKPYLPDQLLIQIRALLDQPTAEPHAKTAR